MLSPCPRCHRHIRDTASRCPFCARRTTTRGAFALGALLLGCAPPPAAAPANADPLSKNAPGVVADAAEEATEDIEAVVYTPRLEEHSSEHDPTRERAHAERMKRRWRSRQWRPSADRGYQPLYGGV